MTIVTGLNQKCSDGAETFSVSFLFYYVYIAGYDNNMYNENNCYQ